MKREWGVVAIPPDGYAIAIIDGAAYTRIIARQLYELSLANFIVNACNQHEERLAQVGHPVAQDEGPE